MDALHLTLRQLQVFVAVANHHTTAAAGREISLSQSATSSALAELERLLRTRLFDRVGQRLQLNERGRSLLPRALAILDGAAGLEDAAHDSSAGLVDLRIGASTTIGSYMLPRMLAGFLAGQDGGRGSEWKARVMIGNTTAVCLDVAECRLDLGLIEGPCHQPALHVMPWLADPLVLVAAPALARGPNRAARRLGLKELREMTWLLREPGSGTREAADHRLLPRLHAYRRSIEMASSEAIKHAAAEGLGIACLSQWVVQDMIDDGRLCYIDSVLPPMSRPCFAVMHRGKQPTAALLRFMQQLKKAG